MANCSVVGLFLFPDGEGRSIFQHFFPGSLLDQTLLELD